MAGISALAYATSAWPELEFDPAVSVGVIRAEDLSVAGGGGSELVYLLRPSFTLEQETNRFSSLVDYQLDGYYYDDRSDRQAYHLLDSEFRATLDPRGFFIDFGANREQALVTPELAIPLSNLVVSANRADRDSYHFGPSLRYTLGSVTAASSYRRRWIRYDEDASAIGIIVPDIDAGTFAFSLDNYQRQEGFTWALRYDTERVDYGAPQNFEYRQATVELGAWIGQTWRLFATLGEESDWDNPLDPSLEDSLWEVGFAKQVGASINVEVATGERSFGRSSRALVELSFRNGATSVSYTEQPTAARYLESYGVASFALGQSADFLSRPTDPERYLSKRLEWSVDFTMRETTLGFRVFDEDREDRARFDGIQLGDEQQRGVYLNLARDFGARSAVRFDLERARLTLDLASAEERDVTLASVGLSRSVGTMSQVSLDYSYSREDANDASAGPEYRAKWLTLLFTRAF